MSGHELHANLQCIFKSLKLITVMVGSMCIVGRSFSVREYLAAILLAASAALFSLGDAEVDADFNTIGVVVVLLSLVFDSVQANTQDRILTVQQCPLVEAILFSNLLSGFFSLLYTWISGELAVAVPFCADHPLTYQLFVVRALILYVGVIFLLTQIKLFGAVTTNVVTTVRKILTVVLSFIIFAHVLTPRHLYGLLAFTLAVCINEFAKCCYAGVPVALAPAPVKDDMV
jgi:adenosine 3'-phospho 5'-phosphosulfate transporter B3